MSTSVRVGFAIGFLLAAILGGAWAWREGLLSPADGRRAQLSGEAPSQAPRQPAPAPSSPAAPTPQPTPPSASPTPPATPPGATPPSAAPPATDTPPTANPPRAANAAPQQPGSSSAPGGVASGPAGQSAAPAPADDRKGAFDVVRVEPSGDAVVAGRCTANCTAELTSNGKVIDAAKADASGSFAMTPPALPPGDHQLGLKVTTPEGGKETSEQTVTVQVPKAPSKDVVVVLNEPDAPSKILQQPGQAPAAATPEDDRTAARSDAVAPAVEQVTGLSLGAIDAENGRFFVQGTAPAGSKLRIYLNDTLVSEATAGADGRWSLRVERGLTSGRYTARVDHIGPDGKVVKRAEAGFDYEPEVAAAEPPRSAAPDQPSAKGDRAAPSGAAAAPQAADPSAPAGGSSSGGASADAKPDGGAASGSGAAAGGEPQAAGRQAAQSDTRASSEPSASGAGAKPEAAKASETPGGQSQADAANPVVASLDTAKVRRGDSLWRISRATYGHGRRYTVIFDANESQIRNPNLIYPGQVLVLPTKGAEAAAGGR